MNNTNGFVLVGFLIMQRVPKPISHAKFDCPYRNLRDGQSGASQRPIFQVGLIRRVAISLELTPRTSTAPRYQFSTRESLVRNSPAGDTLLLLWAAAARLR